MNFLNTAGLTTLWSRILLLVSTELAKLSTVYAAITHTHEISGVVGLQSALDAKAPLASPALTGSPTAPTPAQSSGASNVIATVGYVNTRCANDMQQVTSLYAQKSQIATVNGASLIGGGDVQILAIDTDTLTIDANVTSTSTNPVQSAGVYRAIEGGFWQS